MDEFSDSSWKIAFLLQLPAGATVIVGGEPSHPWFAGLQRLGYRSVALATASSSDLRAAAAVLIVPGSEHSPRVLDEIGVCLGAGAQVLAFFRHRWTAFGGIRTGLRNLVSSRAGSREDVASSMRRLGFVAPAPWLPLPKLTNCEEFVSQSESEEIAASMGLRNGFWMSLRGRLHDGFGLYGHAPGAGMNALAHTLAQKLADEGIRCRLRVTRFDLRERGALVLFLADEASERAFVCRVVRGAAACEHLRRHWDLQDGVRRALSGSPRIRAFVPEAIAAVQINEHRCWLESRAPGTVSWRLPEKRRGRLDAGMIEFLAGLAHAAGVAREICEADISREAGMWRNQIGGRLDAELANLLSELVHRLRTNAVGRTAVFGWVHGDYGYGNALASADDGRLCSIIDWETAAPESFIGVDLFNFLLQRARMRHLCGLHVAAARLIRQIRDGVVDGEMPGAGEFIARFAPERTMQLMILGVTLLRWVLREHRYTVSNGPSRRDLIGALAEFATATQGALTDR